MCEWIHICNDVDSEQDVKKITKTFLWFGNEAFCQNFELLVMQEWVHTYSDLGSGQVVAFRTHTFFNGCKMHCIGNKNNLLCMNGYTYVVMLTMDKR
jgi:hypothetical protein